MPQASPELRKEWMVEGIDSDDNAINYLQVHGYHLTGGYFWILPNPEHKPTDKERSAIQFLINEWDFGGIIEK